MPIRRCHPIIAALLLVVACNSTESVSPPVTEPVPADTTALAGEFTIVGDPTAAVGATWTYRATIDGVAYDLAGVLRRPAGAGPFPAVIISHGFGGSARGYSNTVGAEMVRWGLVTIATNYTHASGAPIGAPGSAAERGASAPNIRRAQRMFALLRSLGYVDMQRVAAHGHSMGAFVTAALAGSSPGAIRAASHTAGGSRPAGSGDAAAPVDSQVQGITAPYQMHHGTLDTVVPLSMDERLHDMLASRGIPRELVVYPGVDHNDIPFSREMYDRVRAWYARHGVLP